MYQYLDSMRYCMMPFLLIMVLASGFSSVTMSQADLNDPREIISKSRTHVMSLESYSVVIKSEGWDFIPGTNAKRLINAAGDIAKNYNRVSNIADSIIHNARESGDGKPIYKKHVFVFKFKKPYLLQMMVVQSDYVPKITWGSLLTYIPEANPNVFYFKPSMIPFAIKRNIGSESGNLLYSMIIQNNVMMDNMCQDTIPVLKGLSKIGGRNAYIIEFSFPREIKLKAHPINFEKWGIPTIARKQFGYEVNSYTSGNYSRIVFFIDKENYLVLARNYYGLDGKLISHREWSDFKLNSLTEKDFYSATNVINKKCE
jgi:hypothetical protein